MARAYHGQYWWVTVPHKKGNHVGYVTKFSNRLYVCVPAARDDPFPISQVKKFIKRIPRFWGRR